MGYVLLCVDMGHVLIFFNNFILYFLCLQFLGFPIYKDERKKRNLLTGQPQGSLSESRWFVVVFICFNLKFTFSCGLPT